MPKHMRDVGRLEPSTGAGSSGLHLKSLSLGSARRLALSPKALPVSPHRPLFSETSGPSIETAAGATAPWVHGQIRIYPSGPECGHCEPPLHLPGVLRLWEHRLRWHPGLGKPLGDCRLPTRLLCHCEEPQGRGRWCSGYTLLQKPAPGLGMPVGGRTDGLHSAWVLCPVPGLPGPIIACRRA